MNKTSVELSELGKYRCMIEDRDLFEQVHPILVKFTSDSYITEMHHTFHSQKNEAMNRSVMKFAPKHFCFSKTMSLTIRIAIAISVNSVGYEKFYRILFSAVGLARVEHCDRVFAILDRRDSLNRMNKKKKTTKRLRAQVKNERWRAEVKKLEVDKRAGRTYSSAVGVDEGDPDTGGVSGEPRKPRKGLKICRCGSTKHQRTSHRECPLNKKNGGAEKIAQSEKTERNAIPDEAINLPDALGLLRDQQNTLLWDAIGVKVDSCNSSDVDSNL